MRVRITDRLSFGDGTQCTHSDGEIAVVHACKGPCHRGAVGYTTKTISNTHPHYLVLERGHHLYLNLIDPDTPLFMLGSFTAFLQFVDRQITQREVLIHCNQGQSRAPSLALLYMAKRLGLLPAESYESAAAAFGRTHPYHPTRGIQVWLSRHWHEIN